MKIDFHVHPYFEEYESSDVISGMKKRDVGATGLAGLRPRR